MAAPVKLYCTTITKRVHSVAGAMCSFLIRSFMPGIEVGARLSERNPIANNCGIISSRPASSPQSVSGSAPASATMMPSNRSTEA